MESWMITLLQILAIAGINDFPNFCYCKLPEKFVGDGPKDALTLVLIQLSVQWLVMLAIMERFERLCPQKKIKLVANISMILHIFTK